MKFGLMFFIVFLCVYLGYSQDFQKVYIDFMKAYDSRDYVRAFKIIDDVISKHEEVPEYFYVKSLDSLNMGYTSGKFSYIYFTNALYRYYNFFISREVYNESVWEKFVNIVDEQGISKLYYEGIKNLFFVNVSNENGLFSLVKNLFSEKNYSEIVGIHKNGLGMVKSPKVAYLVFLSKIYVQDYSNFDDVLKIVAYNYDSDDIRYIVSSVYYHIMDFDNAWNVLMLSRSPDPDLKLRLMVLRKEGYDKIKSFIANNRDRLDKDLVEFVNLFLKGGREFGVELGKRLLSGFEAETLQIALALRFPKNSEVYRIGLEKAAVSFFSRKMYKNVIELVEGYPRKSKNLKLLLAISYFYQGEYRKTLRLLKELESSFPIAKLRIPYVYLKLNMQREAIKAARSLIDEVKNKDDVSKYFLARVFLEFKDFSNFDKVMSYVTSTNHYFYELLYSHRFFVEKRYSECEEILVKLIEEYPYNSEVMNSLAYLWAEQNKNLIEALKLSKFSLIFDEDYTYLDTLAYIYYRMNDFENAKKAIERSISIMEKKGDISKIVYSRASMIYKSLGDEEKSKIMMKKANRSGKL